MAKEGLGFLAFQAEVGNPDMQNYFKAVDLSIEEAQFLFTLIDILTAMLAVG